MPKTRDTEDTRSSRHRLIFSWIMIPVRRVDFLPFGSSFEIRRIFAKALDNAHDNSAFRILQLYLPVSRDENYFALNHLYFRYIRRE